MSKEFKNKLVIPLYLYFDEFEACNPLSSAAGVHKIGALYLSIASIPPAFASRLDNVFLYQLIHSSDKYEFGNEKCFNHIIDELKLLFNTGITVNIDSEEHQIYFVVIALLGDNLGMNSLFGFTESFRAHYFCRFCQISKDLCCDKHEEDEELIRNKNNYQEDVNSLSHGVKEECVFNKLPFFHNTTNNSCDIMHDYFLGICRYDMAQIIKYCVSKQYFTIKHMNERLKFFDYSEADHGNCMPIINERHVQNGHLIMTAAQMSSLINYFGIVVGDLVPPDDSVWELYSTLFEIILLVTKASISTYEISYLKELQKIHNQLYRELFPGNFPAKFHLIVHNSRCIRTLGPLKHFSCFKFEAFHQLSTRYARVVKSRKNITYTLALNLQLLLSFRFFNQDGISQSVELSAESELSSYIKLKYSQILSKNACEVSWIKINSTCYRLSYALYLGVFNDDPVFGVINRIISNKKHEFFFIIKKCATVGLNDHMKGYVVLLPDKNTPEELLFFNINDFIRPIKIHVTAHGDYIISKGDLYY